ncbi:MAG: hypothetical protein SNJ78_11645 [Spirochaetales bacterium]
MGQMLSMGFTLLVFFCLLGDNPISVDLYPKFLLSLKILFLFFSGLNVVGVFASLSRGRKK